MAKNQSTNKNGQVIMAVLKNKDPIPASGVISSIALKAGVNPREVKTTVKETLDAGVRFGFIQRSRRRYYVLEDEQMDDEPNNETNDEPDDESDDEPDDEPDNEPGDSDSDGFVELHKVEPQERMSHPRVRRSRSRH